MTANKNRAWNIAFGNLSARGFNFFYPTHVSPFGRIRERSYQQPPHIVAQLQTPTACPGFFWEANARNQRLAKELQFCLRARAFLLLLWFIKNDLIKE